MQKRIRDDWEAWEGKDFLIEQRKQERDGFFGQLLEASRKVGELESRLLQVRGLKSGSGEANAGAETSRRQ
jgi:hypothetical protein